MLTRIRVMQVALEQAAGTYERDQATPNTFSSILATEPTLEPAADMEERNPTGKYLGALTADTVGEYAGTCTFSCDLLGDGAAAFDAGIAVLLQGCGLAVSSGSYKSISDFASQKTISIDLFEDGRKKMLAGAVGNVTITGEYGKRCRLEFEFSGRWITPTDEAVPAEFIPPTQAPMKLAGGAFTVDSTPTNISTYSLATNNEITVSPSPAADGGINYYVITNHAPELSMDPDDSLVATYDWYGKWLSGASLDVSLGVTDGTDTITIATPKVIMSNAASGDRDGVQTQDFTGICYQDVNASTGALDNPAITLSIA